MNVYSSVETKNSRFVRVCIILFLVFSLVSVFFSVVFLYMRVNIFDYGLYYSKNFPYVKDSRIVMVDFYMSGVSEEKNDVHNENGKCVFEGGNPLEGVPLIVCYKSDDKYVIFKYLNPGYEYSDSINNVYYKLDQNFNVLEASKTVPGDDIELPNVDENKVREDVLEFMNPFISEAQPVPNINLQWFFNWYYKDFYK